MIQINPRSPVLIQLLKYIIVAALAILAFNWFKSCSSGPENPKTQTVIVPEIKGEFKPQKPINIPILIKANSPQLKNNPVYIKNPLNDILLKENEKLKAEYLKMSDSLKLKAFENSIELNDFSSKFEDYNLLININGTVRGEVQEIIPSYVIKERKIEVPIKQTVFKLLVGAEIGSSIEQPKFNVRANLMFQNCKGDIISGSYDTNKNIWIGYNKSIFNIKK